MMRKSTVVDRLGLGWVEELNLFVKEILSKTHIHGVPTQTLYPHLFVEQVLPEPWAITCCCNKPSFFWFPFSHRRVCEVQHWCSVITSGSQSVLFHLIQKLLYGDEVGALHRPVEFFHTKDISLQSWLCIKGPKVWSSLKYKIAVICPVPLRFSFIRAKELRTSPFTPWRFERYHQRLQLAPYRTRHVWWLSEKASLPGVFICPLQGSYVIWDKVRAQCSKHFLFLHLVTDRHKKRKWGGCYKWEAMSG